MTVNPFALPLDSAPCSASPDARLVVLCARPRLNPISRAAITELLATGPDWSAVTRWAAWHQVVPVVFRRFKDDFPGYLPADIAASWQVACDAQTQEARRQLDELLVLVDLFAGNDIPMVPYKGPALALQLYGDVALRPSRDLDFLIPEADIDKAFKVLRARGYVDLDEGKFTPKQTAYLRRYWGQWIFQHPSLGIEIEPHWTLTPLVLAADMDETGIWQRVQPSSLLERPYLSLSAEDQLIALGTHGSKELWNRLKSLCDIARLLWMMNDLDWPVVLDRARQLGVLRMLLIGVSAAHRILGAPLPLVVAEHIAADPGVVCLVDRITTWTFIQPRVLPAISRPCAFRWHMSERWQDRVRFLARTLLLPTEKDILSLSLPDRFFSLYYPIRALETFVLAPASRIMHPVISGLRGPS
jgi:hypothetical protein